MSNVIENVCYNLMDYYFDDLKSQGMSMKESRSVINTPLVTRALSKFSLKILNSNIFQEAYHFKKEYIQPVYKEESQYGFGSVSWNMLDHRHIKDIDDQHNKTPLSLTSLISTDKTTKEIEYSKENYYPLVYLYNLDDYDENFHDENKIPYFENVKYSGFEEKKPVISSEEQEIIDKLILLIPKDSWIYQAINWNKDSYANVLKEASVKVITGVNQEVHDQIIKMKDVFLYDLTKLSNLNYLETNISNFSSSIKSVFGYIDSPIGLLSYVNFQNFNHPDFDYGLSSTGTSIGFRRQGLSTLVVKETLANGFAETDKIIRSSPGAYTDKDYTDHMTVLMYNAKPLVMSHYQGNLLSGLKNDKDYGLLSDKNKLVLVRELRDYLVSKESNDRWENDKLISLYADNITKKVKTFCKKHNKSNKKGLNF